MFITCVGWEQVLDKLILNKPGLSPHIEPDEDVGQGLEEEEGDQGEHGDEGEEVSGGLPLGEGVVWSSVADQEDGDSSQTNICHQILIVTWLCANLEMKKSELFILCRHVPNTK